MSLNVFERSHWGCSVLMVLLASSGSEREAVGMRSSPSKSKAMVSDSRRVERPAWVRDESLLRGEASKGSCD